MTHHFAAATLFSLATAGIYLAGPSALSQQPTRLRPAIERSATGQPAEVASAPTATLTGFYTVAIEGTRQGVFKGEGNGARNRDKLIGLDFAYELLSPRDAATGQATGRRQHKPVVITKEVGAASPQLFSAAATNEVLKTVTIEFLGRNPNGEEFVTYSIKLTNATIAVLRQFQAEGKLLEAVEFSLQKIEVSCPSAKTTATDDWAVNR
jgi:type VI secretion system secreted protein Hcp